MKYGNHNANVYAKKLMDVKLQPRIPGPGGPGPDLEGGGKKRIKSPS